uniref:Uncharacterized protein n=1 Tax=Tanacetum cinerariifolium TaxID=118510 RepID=A0A6L2KH23_TANCI|nr:hypothetical protein [Tanacetum cinerariifolium]
MSGLEEPEQAPPSPVYLPYVPELVYPKYMPPEDNVFPTKEQPLPVADTPTADSPGHILKVDVAPGRPMSEELGYGIMDTWDELVGASEEIAPTTLQGVNQRVTDLSAIVEQGTTIMDRHVYRRLAVMIEREARMACEAWGLSMDARDNAHLDVLSLHTTLVAQHALIFDLQAADCRRQGAIKELLAADHKR